VSASRDGRTGSPFPCRSSESLHGLPPCCPEPCCLRLPSCVGIPGFGMHMRPRDWTDLNGDRPEDGKKKNKDRSATIEGGPGPVRFRLKLHMCCIASAASLV
jgi:hypothetical protein